MMKRQEKADKKEERVAKSISGGDLESQVPGGDTAVVFSSDESQTGTGPI
jgi:hypothetical protein